jgi:ATP-dependent DNA helicase DinG
VTFAHAPIDMGPWLRDRLWTASLVRPAERADGTYDRSVCVPVTVVVVSATIVDDSGSLGYFRETVGLDRCREIVVGSPFNYRENGILYVPTDGRFDSSEARKDRQTWAEYLDRLTDEYERLIRIAGGRAFCLFTSNQTLDYVYSRLMTRGLGLPMMRQGQLPQPELIRQFKAAGNAVLFGVKSYWEGVDVQGSALSIVIISGTPFTPPDDPIYAARCQMVDARYGGRASFQKVSIPEATIALKQAFGRGIRSSTDQAAICILDSRLRYKRYGAGILAALPPCPVVGSTDDVGAFFERIG